MLEHSLLKIFVENAVIYEKYSASLRLDFLKTNYPILYKLFKSLPATSFEALEANYLANYPVLKDGDRETLANMLNSVKETSVNVEEFVPYLEGHLSRAWASEVAMEALDVAEGKKDVAILDTIIAKREAQTVVTEEEVEFVTTDIEQLMEEEDNSPGFTWRLKCLNRSLGMLRKGNFGHIFARVETGKTAMWVSESTHMAQQTEKPVLIFFNEEGGRDVVFRMYNAVTGLTYMEIAQNPKRAKAIWEQKIGNRIKFIDRPALVERKNMEKIIETIDPALIIIDNMDKIKGFTGDRKDLLLHEIYKWGREVAKTQCPVLSVGQADNTGHNSMWLDESQMADSKTSKPSELDFIIGIGRIDKEGYDNVRYINIPKNKLRGSEEAVRHGKFETLIKPALSLYEDL